MSTADAAAPPGPDTHQGRDHTHVEQWLPVVGFESLYEVSDLGRVRSLDRLDTLGRLRRGRIMDGSLDGEGYRNYGLTPKDEGGNPQPAVSMRGHVLVLTAFKGPCPPGEEGCHGNGNPDDNRLANLRWDTRPANHADIARHGTALTSKKRQRQRRPNPRPKRLDGHCGRAHKLVAPNLTAPQPGRPQGRCLACQRGHVTVNDARRGPGVLLDLAVEADQHYARIMGAANT